MYWCIKNEHNWVESFLEVNIEKAIKLICLDILLLVSIYIYIDSETNDASIESRSRDRRRNWSTING